MRCHRWDGVISGGTLRSGWLWSLFSVWWVRKKIGVGFLFYMCVVNRLMFSGVFDKWVDDLLLYCRFDLVRDGFDR